MSPATFAARSGSISVGNEELDRHHQQILAILNKLYEIVQHRRSPERLRSIIEQLVDYTQRQFGREEELMTRCGFPSLAARKELRDRLVERTRELREHEMLTDITAAQDVLRFLKEWSLGHIRGADSQYRPYIVQMDWDSAGS